MKISNKQWDEWFAAPVTDAVSAESELSGIISCMTVVRSGGVIRLASNRLWVFRRVRRLWPKSRWNGDMELNEVLKVSSHKVALEMPRTLYRKIYTKPQTSEFIRWPWMRGVFGCVGSVYNPKRGYYCIMRFHAEPILSSARALLSNNGITCSIRENGAVTEIIIRDFRQIVRFCYFMNLQAMAQDLEKRSIMRYGRDLANKQANCDSANIKRTIKTSQEHIAYLDFLVKMGDRVAINDKLAPLMKARLLHPEASLSELGDLLKPQVSKSTVKYRLKKLLDIALVAGYVPQSSGEDVGGVSSET